MPLTSGRRCGHRVRKVVLGNGGRVGLGSPGPRPLLDRILILNRRHAAVVLHEFEGHYNDHRPHRTLRQAAPSRPLPQRAPTEIHKIERHDRLGGILHEYQQVA